MILAVDSKRSISLPEGDEPGDHVLLIPPEGIGSQLIPVTIATEEELSQAVEGVFEVGDLSLPGI